MTALDGCQSRGVTEPQRDRLSLQFRFRSFRARRGVCDNRSFLRDVETVVPYIFVTVHYPQNAAFATNHLERKLLQCESYGNIYV